MYHFWYIIVMTDDEKKLTVEFYETSGGSEPVREWLKKLDKEDRRIIGIDIKTVEFGWPIGMPICKPLGGGIWEVRSNLTKGRIARVLFCLDESSVVLLHGFIKKSQKTPKPDIEIARKRKRHREVK